MSGHWWLYPLDIIVMDGPWSSAQRRIAWHSKPHCRAVQSCSAISTRNSGSAVLIAFLLVSRSSSHRRQGAVVLYPSNTGGSTTAGYHSAIVHGRSRGMRLKPRAGTRNHLACCLTGPLWTHDPGWLLFVTQDRRIHRHVPSEARPSSRCWLVMLAASPNAVTTPHKTP